MRLRAALLTASLIIAGACAHHLAAPAGWSWGLPIYPGATLQGASTSKAAFVLYRTQDSLADVDQWYAAQLPRGTPHAFSATSQQATFALFDAHTRRTVHVQREGSSTAILLTDVAQ